MAEMIDGFSELTETLLEMSKVISDESIKKKALEAGGQPIVERARRLMRSHKRTGTLDENIISQYNDTSGLQEIGWGEDGFYGRILENGYTPATGKRIKLSTPTKAGRKTKLINKGKSNKYVKIPHIKPAYETEKQNVATEMIKIYKKELESV